MGKLSAWVQGHWGSWGILILTLWALVLTLLAVVNILWLTAIVENTNQEIEISRIWLFFLLNTLFGLGFAVSAFGLWRLRNWGRLLFMGMIFIWAASYVLAWLISLSNSQPYSISELTLNFIPYLLGAGLSIAYLNLPRIKALFETNRE